MISDEVYVEIEVLRKQGLSLRRIAAEVGCAVNTVRAHLLAPGLPHYERKAKRPSKLASYETYLRERQVAAHPEWIPASVLYREIVARGYSGGGSQLRAFMQTLKPTLPIEPIIRFETEPGAQMQVDWVEFRICQRHEGLNPHRLPRAHLCRVWRRAPARTVRQHEDRHPRTRRLW